MWVVLGKMFGGTEIDLDVVSSSRYLKEKASKEVVRWRRREIKPRIDS